MRVRICACQFYHRVPQEKITTLQAACVSAHIPCEVIPDLCYVSAKDHAKLESIGSSDFVFACQPRAVRAILRNGLQNNVTAKCVDLRTEPLDDLLDLLSLTPINPTVDQPVDQPVKLSDELTNELAYEKPGSDWVPWFPVIDGERCVQCKKCVDFCMFGVYTIESETVRVTQPASCKTDCPACARICPQNAIIFPKSDEEKLNGTLVEPVKPSASDNTSFRERLKYRQELQKQNKKTLRLFKEDES